MANNGNYRGYHWSNDYRTDQPRVVEANDAQQIRQELPLQASPHPAFEDAAQMAQYAYAAYLRAQESRRTGTPQSDANAEGPPQSTIDPALAQYYRDPPHGMHQGYQYDQQWQYGQSRPHHQQQQQPQQHSYQPYYQSRFQPQQSAEQQQRERLEERQLEHMRQKERQRLQKEHLKQQKQQEREIEKEKKREESIQRRQEIQQRQQEEKKKRQEEQERQREQKRQQKEEQKRQADEQKRQQKEEQRRQQAELKNRQEEQQQQKEEQRRQRAEVKIRQEEQQQQQYKQRLSEEQQRQQIIRNTQRQQYARSFNSSSPALGHSHPQSHNSQQAQSHTTSSMTPPQQFSPVPASIQPPPPRMSHSPLQPQAHMPSQVSMKRPAATAFADSRSYEHSTPPIRSETPAENSSIVTSRQNMSHHDPPRSATPQNAIPLAQSRNPISTPSEPASLSTPSISNLSRPSEPYTSASRSTLGPHPPLGPGSSTKSGPATQMMSQTRKSEGPVPTPNLPRSGTLNTLDRTISVPDSTKRASLPWIPPNRTQAPISSRPSHSLTGTPKTNAPSLPSVSASTQSTPICETYRPPSTSSAITQAPQVVASGLGLTQPPPTKQYHNPDRASHPKKSDSIPATVPPLPAPFPANAPRSNGFQHQPMPSSSVPRPPSHVWKPGQVAAAGPRFNSPLPGNHYAGQVPPSKMRRLNDGGKQNATVRDSGGPKFRPGDYLRDSPSQSHLTLRKDMIQPINTFEALKKETYDPATIAHDVLINCAKHPTERPLNDHWEPIRKRFPEVDFSKDLSTFRWDLVEECQARTASRTKPNSKPQAAPMTAPTAASLPGRVLGHPAPMAPVTAPTRAPVASNGPPVTGQSQPTLAGLPWIDLSAPRSPVNTKQHQQQTNNPLRELPFQAPTYYSRPVGASPSKHSNLPIGLPAPTPAPAPAPHYEPSQSPSVQLPPPPKPTSSKQPEPTPKHAPKPTPKSTPKAKSTPKSKSNSTSKSKSSVRATPTKPDTLRSQSSKEHSQPLVVVPPSPAKMSFGKRRPGRPKKSTEVAVEIPGSKVQYPVFRCRWESCQAELHNLKALESHLMQGHILNSITCNWEGCSDTTPKAASDMWTHAQEVHLAPLAWQFGDGPKVPVTAEKTTRPKVSSMRNARPGTMALPADSTMVIAFNRAHGNQTLSHTERSARSMTDGGINWLDGAGVTSETSIHRMSPVMCQQTVNQDELIMVN